MERNHPLQCGFKKNPLFSFDGIYFDFVKVQISVCCTARDDMVISFSHRCPMSLVPSFFLMAAVPHEAVREDTFQRQVFIFNSAFESTADIQVLHVTSQTKCSCIPTFMHLQRDGIPDNGVNTIYSWSHISKLGATCESQIQGINCHADGF